MEHEVVATTVAVTAVVVADGGEERWSSQSAVLLDGPAGSSV